MLLYLHHRNSRPFFILQSVITSKMRKYETIKLFELHKAKQKLAGLKNVRPNQFGTFQGRFSMFFGNFFFKYSSVRTKKLHFFKYNYEFIIPIRTSLLVLFIHNSITYTQVGIIGFLRNQTLFFVFFYF